MCDHPSFLPSLLPPSLPQDYGASAVTGIASAVEEVEGMGAACKVAEPVLAKASHAGVTGNLTGNLTGAW